MNNIASEWLKTCISVLFYKKVFIYRSVLITSIFALAAYLLFPPIYHGTFSILVRSSDLDTTRILPGMGVYVQPEAVNPGVMSSEQALLTSDKVLEKALKATFEKYPSLSFSFADYLSPPLSWLFAFVSELSIESDIDENKDLHLKIEALRSRVDAVPIPGARTIDMRISFYDKEILNELQSNILDAYLTSRGDLVTDPRGRSIYSEDSQRYGDTWMNLLESAANIRAKNNVYDSTKQRNELVAQMVALQEEKEKLRLHGKQLDGQMLLVKSTDDIMGVQLSNVLNNQAFVQMEGEIASLEIELANLLGEYTLESPEVRSKQISLNTASQRYRKILINALLSAQQENIVKISSISMTEKELQSRLQKLEIVDIKLKYFDQETALAQESYQTYVRKLREVELQTLLRNTSESSVVVVRSIFVDDKPFWPNALVLFPLALFLGLFFGILGAYVEFYFEDIILQPQDVASFGTPILCSLPDIAES